MGLFQNIKDAEETRFGKYILPGNYIVQIERCKQQGSQKNKKKIYFIVETLVLESDNELRPAGSKMSWVVTMTEVEFPDTAMGNVKSFMNTGLQSMGKANELENIPQITDDLSDEEAEELAEAVSGEENILAGTFLRIEAFNKKTRKDTDFTNVTWDVPQNLEEIVEASKAA